MLDTALLIEDQTATAEAKDNVIPLPPQRLNDAELRGKATPAYQALLDRPATLLIGACYAKGDRRNTRSGKWKEITYTWGQWLTGGPAEGGQHAWGFSHHVVSRDKRGMGYVLGSSPQGERKTAHMDTMFAVGLDIDEGADLATTIAKVEDLGLCCFIYTTHSHTADRHKFRLIFPLAEPVKIDELQQGSRKGSEGSWASIVTGLAVNMLRIDFDTACTDPSRLFYAARHPKDAQAFSCVIVRGDPLKWEEVPQASKAEYLRKRKGADNAWTRAGEGAGGSISNLPDHYGPQGLHLNAWHSGGGKSRFMVADLLEDRCADKIRNVGGEKKGSVHIECPFEAGHSEEGGTATMAINALDAEHGFWTVFCHHDSCQGRHKLEFLQKMLEDEWFEEADLADDSRYMFAAEDDDAVIEPGNVAAGQGSYEPLITAEAVREAFAAAGEMDDSKRYGLCARVAAGGNVQSAKDALNACLAMPAKERDRCWSQGRKLVEKAESAAQAEVLREKAKAEERDFTPSLVLSAPLGSTLGQKIKSLDARFRIVAQGGKVIAYRNVSRDGIEQGDRIMDFWPRESLRQYYDHEVTLTGEGQDAKPVHPVDAWWRKAKRHDRVTFDPSPTPRHDDVNLYDPAKLALVPVKGDSAPILDFIRDIVCAGDPDHFRWVMLWLAHLVQRPWERPGTAIVLYGRGRAGKGTFGHILRKLVEPYAMVATSAEHLIGQFSGPQLATSLVVCSEEAVYSNNGEASRKLKGLVSVPDIQAEAKGVQAVRVPVFFRVLIDGNDDATVRIEGNNSEQRYMVLKISEGWIGRKEKFTAIHDHIKGPAMQAFLHDLKAYDPANAGLSWQDVFEAPETIHRKAMFADGLPAMEKALLALLEDKEFIWRDGMETYRFTFADAENRVPAKALDDYLRAKAGRYDDVSRPGATAWQRLTGSPLAKPKAGRMRYERAVIEDASWETDKATKATVTKEAEATWEPFTANTTAYSFPAISEIRELIESRTGRRQDTDEGASDQHQSIGLAA